MYAMMLQGIHQVDSYIALVMLWRLALSSQMF